MRNKFILTVLSVCIFVFCACQQIDLKNVHPLDLIKKKELPKVNYFDPQTLEPTVTQGMAAVEMARVGKLEALPPYISVDKTAEINAGPYTGDATFHLKSQLITNYRNNPDGTIALEFFSESEDRFGRRDLRINQVAYTTRMPNKKEATAIRQWVLNAGKSHFKKSGDSRNALTNFQQEKGLKPDGLFGAMSARAISKDIRMVHIQKIESFIFHPEIPSHLIFVLPYSLVNKNLKKYSRGFDSLLEVGKHGISAEKFKSMATPGEKFVLFVYFFDRIDPNAALRIGLAGNEQRWSETMSPIYYASSGSWPVITETFSIDDTLDGSDLYANVFAKSGFAYKCLASHRLK